MSLGKQIRLRRIFAHPSGRLCSAAIDHFSIYNEGLPPGLRHIKPTLAALMAGEPDAVTMHKGLALSLWEPYAGKTPLIVQTSAVRPDDTSSEQITTPEEIVRLGGDAMAIVAFMRGSTEALYLQHVATAVREAAPFGLPVIAHVYPRTPDRKVSYAPDDIAWAVRCMVEVGVDVVKVPYCGDVAAHAQIVADCPVPLVAAGGPQTATLEEGLSTMAAAVQSGVQGATIGRNIWGVKDVTAAMLAFKAVIHDGMSGREALSHVMAVSN